MKASTREKTVRVRVRVFLLLVAAIDARMMAQAIEQKAGGGSGGGAGRRYVGDLDRSVKAVDVRSGRVLWETRLATSVQGYPISFAVDGRQYVAVATGLGGGSPRGIPNALSTEIQVPDRGHALYVFALPDK